MTKEEVEKSARELSGMIEALEKDLQSSVESLQAQLADFLIYDLSKGIKVEKDAIKTTGNASAPSAVDRTWNEIFDRAIKPVLAKLVEGYKKVMAAVKGYFTGFGLVSQGTGILERLDTLLSARIGINQAGQLIKTGYLYRLGKSDEVRSALKRFVVSSIDRGANIYEFQKGLRGIITGTPDVEGALVRYYRQYAFDTFNQIAEWGSEKTAQAAGLVFFIYEGSLIDTSRRFCEKRAGKVFHVSETKAWASDPDLVDKKTAASYDPIIDRGRYNCRHIIRWITYELAVSLRPDVVRFTQKGTA